MKLISLPILRLSILRHLSTTTRTITPNEKQFETFLQTLKPGSFTPLDVTHVLNSQPDPDLSLDIFRWTAQQRNYKHDSHTYLTMIDISISNKRYNVAETLIEEVLSGACTVDLALFNTMVKFCCSRKFLFNRAFDVYKKMLKSEHAKPNLETYTLLFNSLLRKFDKLNVSYVYLPAVRSLGKQMKALGVIPDTFVMNMIVKAFSKCREMEEAVRVFREMRLYDCHPNCYTYSYLVRGFCEKGRVGQGMEFYEECKGKGLVMKGSSYLVLVCSLAMERRFEEGVGVAYDMLENGLAPDLLTYKTLLEEMCRDGKGDDAFELVQEFRKRDRFMNEKVFSSLMNGLHFFRRDQFGEVYPYADEIHGLCFWSWNKKKYHIVYMCPNKVRYNTFSLESKPTRCSCSMFLSLVSLQIYEKSLYPRKRIDCTHDFLFGSWKAYKRGFLD